MRSRLDAIHCLCPLRYTSLFGFPRCAYFLQGIRWKKNKDKPVNSLHRKGFPICPYYAIRAYVLGPGSAKRRRRENALRHTGPLFGGLHPRHLRPRDYLHAEAGGKRRGQFPLRYSPALTTPNFGMGHGLGQTGVTKSSCQKKYRGMNKTAEI